MRPLARLDAVLDTVRSNLNLLLIPIVLLIWPACGSASADGQGHQATPPRPPGAARPGPSGAARSAPSRSAELASSGGTEKMQPARGHEAQKARGRPAGGVGQATAPTGGPAKGPKASRQGSLIDFDVDGGTINVSTRRRKKVPLPKEALHTVLAFHPPLVALAAEGNRVVLFDVTSGQEVWRSDPMEEEPVSASFSADGKFLLVTGKLLSNFVWDLENKRLYRTWHRKVGRRQFLSADGSMLIREDVRHSVRWYQLARYKLKWLVKGDLLAMSPDGLSVLVGTKHGGLEIRDTKRGRLKRTLKAPRGKLLKAALGPAFLHGERNLVFLVSDGAKTKLVVVSFNHGTQTTKTWEPPPGTYDDMLVLWGLQLVLLRQDARFIVVDIERKPRAVGYIKAAKSPWAAAVGRVVLLQPDGNLRFIEFDRPAWVISRRPRGSKSLPGPAKQGK